MGNSPGRITKKHHLKWPAKRTPEDDARFEESLKNDLKSDGYIIN